jgi:Tfp pilus assembly protein FimT
VTDDRGAALIDFIVAATLIVILAAIATPVVGGTLERERAIVGAQALRGQLLRARFEALKRARAVAVRIELVGERTSLRLYADGNGNGVLKSDIDHGIDTAVSPQSWLDDNAAGVTLRINQAVTKIGSSAMLGPGDDPLYIGNTALLTFTPVGSATGGTLYVAAPRGPQMAIRVFGATGRIRLLMFDTNSGLWTE